ncbi:hypothetical protein MMC31_004037 [Peltigera leucophlebia]|nr:hypothetical protein [Peltigera leucophlebia]
MSSLLVLDRTWLVVTGKETQPTQPTALVDSRSANSGEGLATVRPGETEAYNKGLEDFKTKRKGGWKMSVPGHFDAMVQRPHPVITKSGDRFENHGMARFLFMIENYAKALAEFNAVFQTRRKKNEVLPTTFVDPIRPKDVRFTKGKRRHGPTNHKAAQAEEADERRRRRAQSIEEARVLRHDRLRNKNHVILITEYLSTSDNKSLQISDADLSVGGQDNHSNDDDFLPPTQRRQSRISARVEENSAHEIE